MENITPLCEIAHKYGTDKCPQIRHHYTTTYYELLKDKTQTFKKVVELGIGSKQSMQYTPEHYQTGASLLMWRDFFPNAHIYGLDCNPTTMMQSDRITTLLVNQKSIRDLHRMVKSVGKDVDLFIDDGLHNESSQVSTAKILLPLFNKNIIYIIEDAKRPEQIARELHEYNCKAVLSTNPVNNGDKQRYEHLVIIGGD